MVWFGESVVSQQRALSPLTYKQPRARRRNNDRPCTTATSRGVRAPCPPDPSPQSLACVTKFPDSNSIPAGDCAASANSQARNVSGKSQVCANQAARCGKDGRRTRSKQSRKTGLALRRRRRVWVARHNLKERRRHCPSLMQ